MRAPWVLIDNLLLFTSAVSAGPAAYGVCQAECASVVMACYSAAGFTWGATMGASAPASVMACNLAFGKCQAACAAVLLAPTLWDLRLYTKTCWLWTGLENSQKEGEQPISRIFHNVYAILRYYQKQRLVLWWPRKEIFCQCMGLGSGW